MGASFAKIGHEVGDAGSKVGSFFHPEAENLKHVKDFASAREVPLNQSVLPGSLDGVDAGFKEVGGTGGRPDMVSPEQIALRRILGGTLRGLGGGLQQRQQSQQQSQPNPYSDFSAYFGPGRY